jgi:hypothetical protein
MGDHWKKELASRVVCAKLLSDLDRLHAPAASSTAPATRSSQQRKVSEAKAAPEQPPPQASDASPAPQASNATAAPQASSPNNDSARHQQMPLQWSRSDIAALTPEDLARLRSKLVVEVQTSTRGLPRLVPMTARLAPGMYEVPADGSTTHRLVKTGPRFQRDFVALPSLRNRSKSSRRSPLLERDQSAMSGTDNGFNAIQPHSPAAPMGGRRRSRRKSGPGPGAYTIPSAIDTSHGATLKFRPPPPNEHPDEAIVGPGRYHGNLDTFVTKRTSEQVQFAV